MQNIIELVKFFSLFNKTEKKKKIPIVIYWYTYESL